MDTSERTLWTAAVLGAFIGLGQLLASGDPIKPRYALGRAIVSAGIAVSSFAILTWIPDANHNLLVGMSAMLASLGTSGLTMLAKRVFNIRDSAE